MLASGILSFKNMRLGLLGLFVAGSTCGGSFQQKQTGTATATPAQVEAAAPLSANDVSWLFPAPTRAEDFSKLIAVRDLTAPNAQDPTKRDLVWPYAVFQQFLGIAASPAAHIGLPVEAQSIDAWFIAGIRIDAGAPGLSSDIRAQFGQRPEIRLIIQPVTRNPDGTPKVLDIAGHLIFDFILEKQDDSAQPGCLTRPRPDLDAFAMIVADVVALRNKLSSGQLGANKVTTSGVPLGVHPGLADATTADNLRREMKAFLERHISGERLDAMAIAGLPPGAHAPWIFLSMAKVPPGAIPALPNGGFIPVPSPTLDGQQFAEMRQPDETVPRVAPQPHTNNLNPITCKINTGESITSLPIANRNGVSTADLFVNPPPSADKTRQVLDVIADPARSHFFNTDCVSCHTETRRAMELLNVTDIPGIDLTALPNDSWNVRNFGWSPVRMPVRATVTRRAAAETAAVVTFINSELATQQAVTH